MMMTRRQRAALFLTLSLLPILMAAASLPVAAGPPTSGAGDGPLSSRGSEHTAQAGATGDAPSVGSFDQDGGTGAVGEWTDLTASFADSDGHEDISRSQFVLVAGAHPVGAALSLGYHLPSDRLWLKGGGVCQPGETSELATANFSLDCGHSAAVVQGDVLTVAWHVRPNRCPPGGCGAYTAYGKVVDKTGLRDVDILGSWELRPTAAGMARWTFMVYLDGDTDLEDAGIGDFQELSSIGSDSEVNILVQFDRIPGYDRRYGNWTDTRRFYVTQGMLPWDHAGESIGEANMGDPQTLIDFVQWGMTTYPAEHYAVVIWDHGSGWRMRADQEPLLKDIAFDDSSGGDALDMPELRSALHTLSDGGAEPLDLVGFDACLMGMLEVDDQLIPYAGVRVGSEETEPWTGWPYNDILAGLVSDPGMSASTLGKSIVDAYYTSYGNSEVQSAVDLGPAYGELKGAVNDFAIGLIGGVDGHLDDIATARRRAQEFADTTYIDLYDFAFQTNQFVSDDAINAAAADVMDAVDTAVIREQHGRRWPGAHGISIYFPESVWNYNSLYDGSRGWLEFTAHTQWDEWLRAYYEAGGH
jgi:hypothetical protein